MIAGDKVKIKENLVGGRMYGSVGFFPSMEKYKGVHTIQRIATNGVFQLIENNWYWSEEMLELVKE